MVSPDTQLVIEIPGATDCVVQVVGLIISTLVFAGRNQEANEFILDFNGIRGDCGLDDVVEVGNKYLQVVVTDDL